jgi:GNAT superfamily N-acetyltransferase
MGNEADGKAVIRPLGEPGDLGWVVMAHGEVYAQEFGWNSSFEALVARIVADYGASPDHDLAAAAAAVARPRSAWIAELDGQRAGCVFCVPADDDPADLAADGSDRVTAQLRILLVHPDARGQGLGGRLVDICLAFARAAEYRRIRLWTNHPLVAARRIYLDRGFVLVKEEPHRSFGVELVGQTYELGLSQ